MKPLLNQPDSTNQEPQIQQPLLKLQQGSGSFHLLQGAQCQKEELARSHKKPKLSTQSLGSERRGRPESNRSGTRHQAKHYTTIWRAQLLYRFQCCGESSSYSSANHKECSSISHLVPNQSTSQAIFQQIFSKQTTSKRCERLFEMLTKLTYARDEEVAKEFFEVYFQILKHYSKEERSNKQREKWITNEVGELTKRKYRWVRSQGEKGREEREFAKLLFIICHSIIATYENDPHAKDLSEFKHISI